MKTPTVPTCKNIIQFGAYYKGDTAQGVGFVLGIDDTGMTQDFLDNLQARSAALSNKLIQDYYSFAKTKQRRSYLLNARALMTKSIEQFNLELYGTAEQPLGQMSQCTRVSTNAFIKVAGYVGFMETIGKINSDNQNGLQLIYEHHNNKQLCQMNQLY